jgi:5-methylcytosine-specific restriction protein A
MRISDLPSPVTAAKVDWLPGTTWLGFSPQGKGPNAKAQCERTIQNQFSGGFVLERVASVFGAPKAPFATDPRILEEREYHAKFADGLIHVHKLRMSSLPLETIIGTDEFEWLQDVWANPTERNRWSVAFPIVQRFEIVGAPKARDVFSADVWTRLFQSQNAGLRRLDDEARGQIASLELREVDAPNFWIAVNHEILAAELSEVSKDNLSRMAIDLRAALEGETAERRVKLIRRAAKLADDFAKWRAKQGTLHCDDCKFDPASRSDLSDIKPRSVFDVHHKNPLAEGKRLTTRDDLALLCPNCHRIEHLRLRQQGS